MSILVSPHELRESIYHGERFTLLATHWQPQLRQSYNEFTSLHIPTALFSDTANSFAGLPGSQVGRNPLPDPDKLQEHFRQWGIREDRPVVVYDEGRGLFAGRAWWTLRWAGLDNVRILDGGLANWRHLGYTTLTGPGNFAVGATAEVNPGQMPVATIDDVRNHDGLLIDTRTRNRFAGRRENLDLKAGHIPGAVNVPERLFHNDGLRTWKSAGEIREVLFDAGLTPDSTAGRAIGYAQVLDYLAGGCTFAEAIESTITGTRRYVRRQRSWFRRDAATTWFDAARPDLADAVAALITDRTIEG